MVQLFARVELFFDSCEEMKAWIQEKDAVLSAGDLGRDLETVRALQRRHQVNEFGKMIQILGQVIIKILIASGAMVCKDSESCYAVGQPWRTWEFHLMRHTTLLPALPPPPTPPPNGALRSRLRLYLK